MAFGIALEFTIKIVFTNDRFELHWAPKWM